MEAGEEVPSMPLLVPISQEMAVGPTSADGLTVDEQKLVV
jgi:hypothetical protein